MSVAARNITQARTSLILDNPFFGALAMRLKMVEDPGCGTAWVDGYTLGYDPQYVESLTHEQVITLLAHEVMHCALGHPWRRGGREPRRFNVAADYAINPELKNSGFSVISGWLLDPQYEGKSAEWIYDRLPVSESQEGQQQESGENAGQSGADGSGEGNEGADGSGEQNPQPGESNGADRAIGEGGCDVRDAPSDRPEGEEEWKQAVQTAAAAAQARGDLPGSMQRFAKAVAQPIVDWRSVLRRFVQMNAHTDYSWSRPNKRYMASGLYLPALQNAESLGPIAVVIDTSGSVDDVTLGQFEAELRAIIEETRPERTHVIYCDAAVSSIEVFEPDDIVELKAQGGGGTDFRPAIKAAEQLDDEPVCLLYLTDLYGTHTQEAPDFPVLWVSTGKTHAPYGEVVNVQ